MNKNLHLHPILRTHVVHFWVEHETGKSSCNVPVGTIETGYLGKPNRKNALSFVCAEVVLEIGQCHVLHKRRVPLNKIYPLLHINPSILLGVSLHKCLQEWESPSVSYRKGRLIIRKAFEAVSLPCLVWSRSLHPIVSCQTPTVALSPSPSPVDPKTIH